MSEHWGIKSAFHENVLGSQG